jgi:hypothetical protein
VTNAKTQTTLYEYFTDNKRRQVTYSNAVVATPGVSFLVSRRDRTSGSIRSANPRLPDRQARPSRTSRRRP